MQEMAQSRPDGERDEAFDAEAAPSAPALPGPRHRILLGLALLVLLGLAVVVPPLVNVNRYQRRVTASIASSLGRPVHLDSVKLNLLPLPGFTLTNFVVAEDPAFGFEPVIHANSVRATLRMRSLWHRRLEFSRIALQEPSVNLVHLPDGRWNIESILLRASHIPVVPTDQRSAAPGGIQRFPYIEATGARVNLKQGLEKQPISLIDAEFALWLPQPEMWRIRLEARPARTDTAAADSGILRVAGTLGKADRFARVPLALQGSWTAAPLGAVSWLFLGRDAGMRGDLTVYASVEGTLQQNISTARLELRNVRRAEFVPAQTLEANIHCKADAFSTFHSLKALQCAWLGANGNGLTLAGDLPRTGDWRSAEIEARWKDVPLSGLMNTLRVASQRAASSNLRAAGEVSGEVHCCEEISGSLSIPQLSLSSDTVAPPLLLETAHIEGTLDGGVLTLSPLDLNLDGTTTSVLSVRADRRGLQSRLTGSALRSRLVPLASAFPQLGDGLNAALPPAPATDSPETPMQLDLVSTGPWGGPQKFTGYESARKRLTSVYDRRSHAKPKPFRRSAPGCSARQ